jgi:hypothetical protein
VATGHERIEGAGQLLHPGELVLHHAREAADHASAEENVAHRAPQETAAVARLEGADVPHALLQAVGQIHHHARALGRRHAAPGTLLECA